MTAVRIGALAGPGRPLARAGALGIVALVAVLSLMPNLSVPDGAPNHTDLIIHLLIQGTLGCALVWAWPRHVLGVALGLGFLVIALEAGQIWVPGRSFALADLAANALGAGLGAGAARALIRRLGHA